MDLNTHPLLSGETLVFAALGMAFAVLALWALVGIAGLFRAWLKRRARRELLPPPDKIALRAPKRF
jgi:hypothetical protein